MPRAAATQVQELPASGQRCQLARRATAARTVVIAQRCCHRSPSLSQEFVAAGGGLPQHLGVVHFVKGHQQALSGCVGLRSEGEKAGMKGG